MRDLQLRIKSEFDKSGTDAAARGIDKVRGAADKAALPAAAMGTALLGGAAYTQRFASDVQQAMGGVDAVFGDYAESVKKNARAADQQLGLSDAAYAGLANQVGGSLSKAGFAADELAGKTHDLMSASADLSSVFGGTTAEVTEGMGAALRGEFDTLERFGVFLNAAAVEAELARTGQDKLTGAALDAAKKQATYNLIMDQASSYAGNYAREAGTAAGAEERAAAAREDAAAALGQAVLPAYTAFQTKLASVATWVANNTGVALTLAATLGTLAAVVLGVNVALRAYSAVTTALPVILKAAKVAQAALNVTMLANPVFLIVAGVVALVAILVVAYRRSETFRLAVNMFVTQAVAGFRTAGANISAAWSAAMSFVQSLISGAQTFVAGKIDAIRAGWEVLTAGLTAAWDTAMQLAQDGADLWQAGVDAAIDLVGDAVEWVVDLVSDIGSAFSDASSVATGALDAIISSVQSVIGWVQDALDKIGSLKAVAGALNIFGSQGGPVVPGAPGGYAMTSAAAPYTSAVPSATLSGSTTSGRRRDRQLVHIEINGALDPVAVARQLRGILADYDVLVAP